MKSNHNYKQGIFQPKNREKCLNKKGEDIVFRSFLEFKVMNVCDENPNVLTWSSEKTIIPYFNPVENRIARYFIDFYIELKTESGTRKCLVEVKPERQTKPPVPSNRKKMQTVLYENIQYTVNNAKWKAAKEYAKKKGYEFLLLTEKDIDVITKKPLL